jgi:hypothetical protein
MESVRRAVLERVGVSQQWQQKDLIFDANCLQGADELKIGWQSMKMH